MAPYPDPRLTDAMVAAARNTTGGKLVDRLIDEEIARGGDLYIRDEKYPGSVIQQIWGAMMDAQEK